MKSIFGNNLILSLFGESHNKTMGITIHGLKAGIYIDYDYLNKMLERRKPNEDVSNARKEADDYEIISGVFNGYTTGEALTILVQNNNTNSYTYEKGVIRPSHSDYPRYVRSNGFNDYRGGGASSGRLSVLLVLTGAICMLVLNKHNIIVSSRITSIGTLLLNDKTTDNVIKEYLDNIKENNDSVGGMIEGTIKGVPIGVGEPFFDSVESILSHLLFSIPSVKAVEFGKGVMFSNSLGSEVKDELKYVNDNIEILSNNNGGINGGLTNGLDIVTKVTFKPIPTIMQAQHTINMETKENITKTFTGKHDVCVVLRSGVIVESVLAIGILDLLMSYYGKEWM